MKCYFFEIHMNGLIKAKKSLLIYKTKAAAKRNPKKFRLGGAEFFSVTSAMPVRYVCTFCKSVYNCIVRGRGDASMSQTSRVPIPFNLRFKFFKGLLFLNEVIQGSNIQYFRISLQSLQLQRYITNSQNDQLPENYHE